MAEVLLSRFHTISPVAWSFPVQYRLLKRLETLAQKLRANFSRVLEVVKTALL